MTKWLLGLMLAVMVAGTLVARKPSPKTSWGCWWEYGELVCDWIDS